MTNGKALVRNDHELVVLGPSHLISFNNTNQSTDVNIQLSRRLCLGHGQERMISIHVYPQENDNQQTAMLRVSIHRLSPASQSSVKPSPLNHGDKNCLFKENKPHCTEALSGIYGLDLNDEYASQASIQALHRRIRQAKGNGSMHS